MWLTFFKKCKPVQNLLFTLFAALFIRIRPKGDNVRSGLIALVSGSLRHFGLDGRMWSRSATDSSSDLPRALYLNFAPRVIHSSDITGRAIGDPVRCLIY